MCNIQECRYVIFSICMQFHLVERLASLPIGMQVCNIQECRYVIFSICMQFHVVERLASLPIGM